MKYVHWPTQTAVMIPADPSNPVIIRSVRLLYFDGVAVTVVGGFVPNARFNPEYRISEAY
jgi:hypothetical protein